MYTHMAHMALPVVPPTHPEKMAASLSVDASTREMMRHMMTCS